MRHIKVDEESSYRTIVCFLTKEGTIEEHMNCIGQEAKKMLTVTSTDVDNIVRD